MRILRMMQLFYDLPRNEKVWLLLIYPMSGVARVVILGLPFRWLAPILGEHYQNVQVSTLASDFQRKRAWRIGEVAALAAKYTPWESKCLVQASIAVLFYRYYKIPYILYLGVMKSEEDELKAHAWVSVGRNVVTGREGHRAFTIVSTFTMPSLLDQDLQALSAYVD